MSKKKLTDVAETFDDWLAAYLYTNNLTEEPQDTLTMLHDIARAAYMRGYIRGSNAMNEVWKNKYKTR